MQKAIHPLRYIYITTKMYENSHIGKPAMDFGWLNKETQKCYAPFDCVVKKIYKEDANEVWIESKEPVLWANGTVDYMTLLLIHDNDVSNLYVGKELKQGEYFYDMGNKGQSSGVHLHLEVGKGKFTNSGWHSYNINGNTKWRINNGVEIQTALMLSEDTILDNGSGYAWSRESEVNLLEYVGSPVQRDTKKEQLEVIVKQLRARKTPNGEIIGFINLGVYNVLNAEKNGDYTWYQVEDNKWIAYQEDWITLYPEKEDIESNKLKVELENLKKENQELKDKNSLLEKENKQLKEDSECVFSYKALEDCKYKIHLKENEVLCVKNSKKQQKSSKKAAKKH